GGSRACERSTHGILPMNWSLPDFPGAAGSRLFQSKYVDQYSQADQKIEDFGAGEAEFPVRVEERNVFSGITCAASAPCRPKPRASPLRRASDMRPIRAAQVLDLSR